jgi:hypothetical protein
VAEWWDIPFEAEAPPGTLRLVGRIRLDGPTLMGYVLSQLHLSTFDNSDAGASVAGSQTVTVRTISGKGTASVVLDGTGSAFVQIKYSVDGGADTLIGTSDQALYIALSFATTLVLKAVNTDTSAHNRAGISSTGVTQ